MCGGRKQKVLRAGLFVTIKLKWVLTAAGLWPPALQSVIAQQAAGSTVGLQELTVETVHRRVSAQRVIAGGDVRLRVDVAVTGSERRLLQEITAVVEINKMYK